MQAIVTRYVGPTNHRGARVIARCDAKRRTFDWNYRLGIEENHRAAALALVRELGWTAEHYGELVTGSLPANGGYAHVIARKGA